MQKSPGQPALLLAAYFKSAFALIFTPFVFFAVISQISGQFMVME